VRLPNFCIDFLRRHHGGAPATSLWKSETLAVPALQKRMIRTARESATAQRSPQQMKESMILSPVPIPGGYPLAMPYSMEPCPVPVSRLKRRVEKSGGDRPIGARILP